MYNIHININISWCIHWDIYTNIPDKRSQVIYYGFILCSLTLTGLAGFINYALIGAKRDTIDRMGQSTGQLPLDDAANYGVMIAGLFLFICFLFVIFLEFPNPNLEMIIASDYILLILSDSGCFGVSWEDFPAWLGPTWSFWSSSTWTARAASWFITWRWNHRALRIAPSARISRTGFWCGPAWWCIQWSAIGPSWRRVFLLRRLWFFGATPKIPAWEHLPFFPNGSNAPIQTSSFNISHFAIPSFFRNRPSPVFSSQVAWYGKKVCGHDPSSKEGLKGAQQISEDSADASTAVGDVSEASRA